MVKYPNRNVQKISLGETKDDVQVQAILYQKRDSNHKKNLVSNQNEVIA